MNEEAEGLRVSAAGERTSFSTNYPALRGRVNGAGRNALVILVKEDGPNAEEETSCWNRRL